MTMAPPQLPQHCPGVIQRLVHPAGGIGHTEWLQELDQDARPMVALWTRDPLQALVFRDHEQPGGKTGYERAAAMVDRLKEELGEKLIYPMTREVKRPETAPAMPRGFFSAGKQEQIERRQRQAKDWRVGISNCGVD